MGPPKFKLVVKYDSSSDKHSLNLNRSLFLEPLLAPYLLVLPHQSCLQAVEWRKSSTEKSLCFSLVIYYYTVLKALVLVDSAKGF